MQNTSHESLQERLIHERFTPSNLPYVSRRRMRAQVTHVSENHGFLKNKISNKAVHSSIYI